MAQKLRHYKQKVRLAPKGRNTNLNFLITRRIPLDIEAGQW
jgi:hypothetical protein